MRGGGKNFSLFTFEKANFGGYLPHSDVLILKLWFAVHRLIIQLKLVRPFLSVFLRQAAVHGA